MENEKNALRTKYEKEILAIADEMAASVSSLNSHTYDTFISSRERLQTKVHNVLCELDK
jgi:hypothetical protein